MADYIYLLQNRLSAPQQAALQSIRDVAKAHGLTVFLVGGAVRDLTSGSPVRDLDVVVQGNVLKLKKEIELAGAGIAGEMVSSQVFFARFPGGVRVEIGSTLTVSYPKPGKPVAQPATILDDLRRRDFTANAMALSLNDGSYGLLMDPLNGVADIENRQLRLVSNYGFIEDPVRMIRAARFSARLGWTMDEKTQTRYDTGRAEKYIGALSATLRGYETEEIFHEEDPLRVLRKLEEEGWMKHLFPALTVAKANVAEVERLREVQTQFQMAGINPDAAAANFPLLTAKLSSSEVADLKKSFVRQGFVREVENLEAEAKEFSAVLAGKGAALPSQAWKLIHAAKPEAVLWAAHTSKNPAVQAKLKSFHTEWPKARQKVPFALMQEMRIVPETPVFNEVVEKVFFELMDGNLTTPEEQKIFLEPFSPPAPPPPVRLGRSRAGKKEGKASKGKKKVSATLDEEGVDLGSDLDLEDALPHAEVDGDESGPVVPTVDEDYEALIEEPEPERETESAPEPHAAMLPEPVKNASKTKRGRSIHAPAPALVPEEPSPVSEVAVAPPAKIKPVPAKKAIPAKPLSTEALDKAQAKPVIPSLAAETPKPSAKSTKVPAKKTAVAAPPTKQVKTVTPAPLPPRGGTGKKIVSKAIKTAPVKATPSAETSGLKKSIAAVKPPTKKR